MARRRVIMGVGVPEYAKGGFVIAERRVARNASTRGLARLVGGECVVERGDPGSPAGKAVERGLAGCASAGAEWLML